MADRTAATIYGRLLDYVADMPQTEERDHLAWWIAEQARGYDFYLPAQLESDGRGLGLLVDVGVLVKDEDEDGVSLRYAEACT